MLIGILNYSQPKLSLPLPPPASFMGQALSSIVPGIVRIAGPKWGPNRSFRVPRAHGLSRREKILHWQWLFRADIFKRGKASWRRCGLSYILKEPEETANEEAGKHSLGSTGARCV